jgi:hypothetical protein
MHFAMIKTHVQQDMQMLHRIRQLHVKQVTAISNQLDFGQRKKNNQPKH